MTVTVPRSDPDPFRQSPALLEEFRRGEPAALERVYRAFYRPLRNFVLRGFAFKSEGRDVHFHGLWTAHDLEDIVQETFRRAFGARARAAYDGVRPYKNYLFTIARNAVINDLLVRNRQVLVGEALTRDSASEDLGTFETWLLAHRAALDAVEPQTSDESIENLEIFALIESYRESLRPDEATFFQVRFLSACSQEETARRLGYNRARVRKLEARLRRDFLCHVQGTGYLEQRRETRVVRRADDPARARATFERARAIWRERRADQYNEFLTESAA